MDRQLAVSRDFSLPRRSPSAIFKQLAEGAVLFSTQDEVYFGMNAVGASIWELLPPVTSTFFALCDELARRYPSVELERIRVDARQYIDELLVSGLVVPGDDGLSHAQASHGDDSSAR